MSQVIDWDVEKFKEDIGCLISIFNSLFLSDVASLLNNPNGNRIESMRGLIRLDLAKVQRELHEVLERIEVELRDNAENLLLGHNWSASEVREYLSNNFYHGFIKSQVLSELNSTLSQLRELTILATSHLHVLESNSGLSGFFRGLFKGYNNPIDGVSHIFGHGSMQIEVNASVQGFNTAAVFVGQSIDSVSKLLQQVVLTNWNKFGVMLESSPNK